MSGPGPNRKTSGPGRRPGDVVFAAFFLVVSLLLLSQLGNETKWVQGTRGFAQPAFWPAVGLVGMSLFACLHFLGTVLPSGGKGHVRETVFWFRSLEYAIWFMAYVWIVPLIGYLPATLFFVVCLALRNGYRDPPMLLKAAGMGVVIVVVFKGLLSVKIPGGQLYEHLPDGMRNFMLLYL